MLTLRVNNLPETRDRQYEKLATGGDSFDAGELRATE
jgi:hypothetical protein